MEHVRELAEVIGPRPATTDAEASAADYIEDVFTARGLEVERQEFDCPRTYSWAYVAYHVLTIGAAVLSRWWAWPALALAVVSAVLMWLDLDTRFGLSQFMPKGPSQNVIARHIPRQRRGERLRHVVIVAHYDSAKASLAFSPSLVKNFGLSFGLMKWTTTLTPLSILIAALPFAATWRPWSWYATLAVAAYLVFPLLINVHRELVMHAVDGANDNASGVAAMLGVMEATVPEPDQTQQRTQPLRRAPSAAYEADVVIEDALLEYKPMESGARPPEPLPTAGDTFGGLGDVGWSTGPLPPVEPAVGGGAQPSSWADLADDDEPPVAQEEFDFGGEPRVQAEPEDEPEDEPIRRRSFSRARGEDESKGVRDWLGIGRGFDVRKAGKEIGSWEKLSDDEDDEFGFKAGSAGDFDLDFDNDAFAAEEAARIRRRVTQSIDRALSEKEVWFVATGAEEAGTWGMRAFLDAYGADLRDALIINVDNVGSGTVHYITDEGMARRYHCDRRLASQAKRTARENGLPVKGRSYRGLSTDATPALARRYRAMSVMAFDINGRLPDWHWQTDTVENVDERTVQTATDFVAALVREL